MGNSEKATDAARIWARLRVAEMRTTELELENAALRERLAAQADTIQRLQTVIQAAQETVRGIKAPRTPVN